MNTLSRLASCLVLFVAPAALLPAQELEAPVPVRMVPPSYPTEMRKERTGGVVTVSCVVDEKGQVTETEVIKATHQAFVQPALDALRKWRFKPAKRGGTPVALKVQIPIQFTMADE
jgi:protein TonB